MLSKRLPTVLLVEDDADQLAIRAMLFRREGFRVLEASSCAEALAATDYQCAVVDLRLPNEQDGLRLIKCLREANPALLLYVLSGLQSPVIPLANGVFRKGDPIRLLLDRLRQAV